MIEFKNPKTKNSLRREKNKIVETHTNKKVAEIVRFDDCKEDAMEFLLPIYDFLEISWDHIPSVMREKINSAPIRSNKQKFPDIFLRKSNTENNIESISDLDSDIIHSLNEIFKSDISNYLN